jgi:hypothetical protein
MVMDILTDQDMDKYVTGPQSTRLTGTVTTKDMEKRERGSRKALSSIHLKDEVKDIILLCLESYEPVRSALITQENPPMLSDIIAAIKQYGTSQAVIHTSSNSPDSSEKIKVKNLNDVLAATYVQK